MAAGTKGVYRVLHGSEVNDDQAKRGVVAGFLLCSGSWRLIISVAIPPRRLHEPAAPALASETAPHAGDEMHPATGSLQNFEIIR